MADTEKKNLGLIRDYLAALQSGAVGDSLAGFFDDEAMQVEFPNQLNPDGQRSDLSALLSRSVQGQKMLSSQRYEIQSELAEGDRVAVEATWVGTLAIPVGTLVAGAEIRAHFAMFFTCHGGRILVQHNYDCFEAW